MEIKINLKAIDNVSNVIERIRNRMNSVSAEGQKQMGKIFEGTRAKITGMLGGIFPRRKRSVEGGEGEERGGLAGIFGKGAGGMLGKLAALTIVVGGIFKLIKSIVGFLAESSPLLKGVLKMLKIGFMLIMKPLGDALAMVLMPLARFLLQFQKRFAKQQAEAMKSGDAGAMVAIWVAMIQELLTVMWNEMVSAIQNADWGEIFKKIGEYLYNVMIWWYTSLGDFLMGIAKWLIDEGPGLVSGFLNWLGGALVSLGQMILEGLGGFGEWLWNSIVGAIGELGEAIGKFGGWLWNSITGAIGDIANWIGDFGSWLWEEITGAIGDLGEWIGNFGSWLWNQITGAIGEIGSFFGNIDLGGEWIPGVKLFQEGGIVTKPTLGIVGEAGAEAVIPLDKLNKFTPSNVEIHIHGNVFGVTDLQRVIEDSIDEYAMRLRLI